MGTLSIKDTAYSNDAWSSARAGTEHGNPLNDLQSRLSSRNSSVED